MSWFGVSGPKEGTQVGDPRGGIPVYSPGSTCPWEVCLAPPGIQPAELSNWICWRAGKGIQFPPCSHPTTGSPLSSTGWHPLCPSGDQEPLPKDVHGGPFPSHPGHGTFPQGVPRAVQGPGWVGWETWIPPVPHRPRNPGKLRSSCTACG